MLLRGWHFAKGVNLRPKFDEGDLIFVDPEAEYIYSSYVVAHLDDNQATFKQLIIENGHKFLKAIGQSNWYQLMVIVRWLEKLFLLVNHFKRR